MITYLSRLTAERDSLTQAATDLAERAAHEDRDLTDTEQTSMRSWSERCAQIDTQLTEYGAQADSQRAYARLRTELEREPAPGAIEHRGSAPAAVETRSWGDALVSSDAFRNYQGFGASARVEVPSPLIETRAEITSEGWVGTIPPYVYTPPAYTALTPVLDVVGKVTTGSNSVEWIKWTPNPQTAASVVAEGAPKPEATMTATPSTDTLDTYAHWKAITRQALEDIPQIRSLVEGRLRQGIFTALEEAVTDALLTDATIPAASVPVGGALIEAIRVGVATVQSNGFAQPNAVMLNPADWASIDFAIMSSTLGGPTLGGPFWGLRPIAVPSLPAGTAYVGDFQAAVTLFSRGTTALYMTDSHADYFVRNLILLLAEIRAMAAVPEPMAAAKCSVALTGTTGATGGPGSGGK